MNISEQVKRAQAVVSFISENLDRYDEAESVSLSLLSALGTDHFESDLERAISVALDLMNRSNFLREDSRLAAEEAISLIARKEKA